MAKTQTDVWPEGRGAATRLRRRDVYGATLVEDPASPSGWSVDPTANAGPHAMVVEESHPHGDWSFDPELTALAPGTFRLLVIGGRPHIEVPE